MEPPIIPSDKEETQRLNRLGAQYELEFLVKVREATLEQAASMAKWLLASLLAINGGGALATLNSIGKIDSPLLPSLFFVCGMLLSLTSASIIQRQNYQMLKPLHEMMGYWVSVIDDGDRIESLEEELAKKARDRGGPTWLAPSLGWISGIFFVLGAGTLGKALVDHL